MRVVKAVKWLLKAFSPLGSAQERLFLQSLFQESQLRNLAEDAAFHPVFVEQSQAFKVLWIKPVIDIFRQVIRNQLGRETQLWRPGRSNFLNVLQPIVPRLLEYLRDIWLRPPTFRAALRTAQKAKTNGRPVQRFHSSARS